MRNSRAAGAEEQDLVLSVKQENDMVWHGVISVFIGTHRKTLFSLNGANGPFEKSLSEMVAKCVRFSPSHDHVLFYH
jgi:hypothetical protein